ncbi:MAG TPA: glycerophosphodiester phosphodiesterase family protein [Saprospiraceae bacterium]|nr:glycerophosphodiester phosphodiesterase family protein [Saprospiraceae bacterium]
MVRMNMVLWLLLSIFFLFPSCKNDSVDKAPPPALSMPYSPGQPVAISAHRGGKLLDSMPENSLETMDYLYRNGITMFEVDVNQAGDETLVLLHDKSLERTTTGADRLKNYSYRELRQFNLVDHQGVITPFKIPRLKDVLHWTGKRNEVVLQLDLKRAPLDDLAMALDSAQVLDQVIIIAYSLSQALDIHQKIPSVMLSVNMRNEKEFKTIMNSKLPKDRLIAFTGTRLSNPGLYQKIHEAGIKCILGTLGNLDRAGEKRNFEPFREYIDMGIDVLATDMPLKAYAAVGQLKTK